MRGEEDGVQNTTRHTALAPDRCPVMAWGFLFEVINFLCCLTASSTNSEFNPGSMMLRLYAAQLARQI